MLCEQKETYVAGIQDWGSVLPNFEEEGSGAFNQTMSYNQIESSFASLLLQAIFTANVYRLTTNIQRISLSSSSTYEYIGSTLKCQ